MPNPYPVAAAPGTDYITTTEVGTLTPSNSDIVRFSN